MKKDKLELGLDDSSQSRTRMTQSLSTADFQDSNRGIFIETVVTAC